jgi:hypothetical protein
MELQFKGAKILVLKYTLREKGSTQSKNDRFYRKALFSEGIAKTYMILGVSVACLESLLLLELRFNVSPKFESSKKFCEYFFALKLYHQFAISPTQTKLFPLRGNELSRLNNGS